MTNLHRTITTLAITIFIIFSSSIAQAGKETAIEFSDVPEALIIKIEKLMPNATFSTANTEREEDGGYVYEIQGLLEDGRKVEVDIYPDGKIQEIEVEFTKDLVPGAVLNAIEKQYPGFEPTFIEASHSGSKKVLKYELVGIQNGKELDLEVSADGRKIVESDK